MKNLSLSFEKKLGLVSLIAVAALFSAPQVKAMEDIYPKQPGNLKINMGDDDEKMVRLPYSLKNRVERFLKNPELNLELNLELLYQAGLSMAEELEPLKLEGAEILWKFAAAQGHRESQFELGEIYKWKVSKTPEQKNKNLTIARGYYALAAAQNHPKALYRLGVFKMKGHGGPQDMQEGLKFIAGAAALGVEEAEQELFYADYPRNYLVKLYQDK